MKLIGTVRLSRFKVWSSATRSRERCKDERAANRQRSRYYRTQIAAKANAVHKSQEMKEEADESSQFVLTITNVGDDENGTNNLFENVNDSIKEN